MKRRTNARIAGLTLLLYIAVALPSTILFGKAASGGDPSARLTSIAQHATEMRGAIMLSLASCFAAIVLAVTLYAITRDQDRDIALIGFACRLGEGLVGASFILTKLELLWLATASGVNAPDAASTHAFAMLLFSGTRAWNIAMSAIFFAVGSTAFSWLLLRGRMIPPPLAWIGVVASVVLVVGLPLQLAELIGAPLTSVMWAPMLAFEVPLAFWLLFKGVAPPTPRLANR
jgi:hypothetical protein